MATTRPILISGAGISSLLLAQSLKSSSIPFRIFERDRSFTFRAQGYRLRLSEEGLSAIEAVLPPDLWTKFWDTCGKTGGGKMFSLNAVTGEPLTDVPPPLASRGGKIVGIARGDMRRIFAEGCEEFIEWGRKVTGYELTGSGVKAVFEDGTTSEEGSLLIAGEGVRSQVAKQLSRGALKVFDTGARGVQGQAPTTAFKSLGEGVFRIRDESNPAGGIFTITNVRERDMNDSSLNFGWTLGGAPGTVRAPNDDYSIVGPAAAAIAKELTKGWHPKFRPLFDEMVDSEAAFWKITCSTPTGVPEWENVARVTAVGDAAHAMTPAGGLGANTAVRDAELLGRLLRESGGKPDGVTRRYEQEMRVYGSEAVRTSYGLAEKEMGIKIDVETTPTVSG